MYLDREMENQLKEFSFSPEGTGEYQGASIRKKVHLICSSEVPSGCLIEDRLRTIWSQGHQPGPYCSSSSEKCRQPKLHE